MTDHKETGRETARSAADFIEDGMTNKVRQSVRISGRFGAEQPVEDETDPTVIATRWMKASFPGSPIFENRVRSLAEKFQYFFELGQKQPDAQALSDAEDRALAKWVFCTVCSHQMKITDAWGCLMGTECPLKKVRTRP